MSRFQQRVVRSSVSRKALLLSSSLLAMLTVGNPSVEGANPETNQPSPSQIHPIPQACAIPNVDPKIFAQSPGNPDPKIYTRSFDHPDSKFFIAQACPNPSNVDPKTPQPSPQSPIQPQKK
jgi:hypothetical protein